MRLTERAHLLLEAQISAGDLAIDATAGNGYDVAKLAELVGPKGKVIAIDLQAQAVTSTQERLNAHQLDNRCELIQADHSKALQGLLASHTGQVSAITFNLGYLPGSDKSIQTLTETTLSALDASAQLLQLKGLLLVTAYRGHPGGEAEAAAVANWMQAQPNLRTESYEPKVHGPRIPPILWVARKRSEG